MVSNFCDISALTILPDFFPLPLRRVSLRSRPQLVTPILVVDFDNRMVNHFVQEFKRKNKKDITGNPGLSGG
jgi:hypothetical protein